MPRKQEHNWNLEELTDADVYSAIGYLDPDLVPIYLAPDPIPETGGGTTGGGIKSALFVTCLGFLILLLGCVAALWLDRTSF